MFVTKLPPPPGAPVAPEEPLRVFVKLGGEAGDGGEARYYGTGLRIGRVPAGGPAMGVTTKDLSTFLKEKTGWDRWGNWVKGTPFPVYAVYGDRILTGFAQGEVGYIETESAKIDWLTPAPEPPVLPASGSEAAVGGNRVAFGWPGVGHPVGVVFRHTPRPGGSGGAGDLLTIHLNGAAGVAGHEERVEGGGVTWYAVREASETLPPRIELEMAGPLWGFGMETQPFLSVAALGPPRLEEATAERPLAGLRVMVDAGHGGGDLGGIGPSGLCEADLNLVQAAWLERYLEHMGATVKQVRRGTRRWSWMSGCGWRWPGGRTCS